MRLINIISYVISTVIVFKSNPRGGKMINVLLRGHDFRHDIEELIKVFGLFKDIAFISEEREYNNRNDFFLINEVIEKEEKCFIRTKLSKDNQLLRIHDTSYIINLKDSDIKRRKELKRNIKVNIFDILVTIFNNDIPWGILTGIRPTKIVHEFLDNNKSVEGIKQILKDDYRISSEKIELLMDIALCERKYIYPINEDLVSVYVSIPFCPTRCIYCSFPSNPIKEGSNKIEDYLEALYNEIQMTSELLKEANKKVESIYIGGGTPTTLSWLQLDNLIKCLRKSFDTSELKEFTVEAGRPDTIDIDKLKTLKENGIDRISINPQTMNLKTLELIGRKHTPQEIERAFYSARRAGFDTVNMDIIIGLPGEGIDEVQNTMEAIKTLDPENLTVHTLAVKRSSRLKGALGEFKMCNEDLVKEMLAITKEYNYRIGLHPYYMYRQKYMVGNLENVGYCKKGHECLYNMQIMEEKQSIIALGAGGVSKIVFPMENRLERVPNVKNVDEYIKRVDEMVKRKRKQII